MFEKPEFLQRAILKVQEPTEPPKPLWKRGHDIILHVYYFDELPKEVQQKVIDEHREINLSYEWWDFLTEDYKERLSQIGVECEHFFWSIDRDRYFYMQKPYVSDDVKFLRSARVDLRRKDAKYMMNEGIKIQTHYYGGQYAKNYITTYDGEETELANILTEHLHSKFNEFLKELDEAYEYYSSDEAIAETLRINDFTFFDNGKPFK